MAKTITMAGNHGRIYFALLFLARVITGLHTMTGDCCGTETQFSIQL